MSSNRNTEAHRRARKARKRANRRRGEQLSKSLPKCSHLGFPTRMAAVRYGIKRYASLRVAAKCPVCGKFVVD